MGCVYKITNKENGKFYVGSTCDLKRRMHEHFGELKRGVHYAKKMQKDYDIYGRNSFVVEILETCENDLLKDIEQKYLDELEAVKNGYNVSFSSKTNTKGIYYTPKSGKENPFYGHHHTEKTKEILRKNGEMHIGTKHKESTIQLMKEKSKRGKNANATPILQYDLNMNFIREWDCVADIVEYYHHSGHSHVSNCCERNYQHKREKWCTAKGFIWMYKYDPKRKKVV